MTTHPRLRSFRLGSKSMLFSFLKCFPSFLSFFALKLKLSMISSSRNGSISLIESKTESASAAAVVPNVVATVV